MAKWRITGSPEETRQLHEALDRLSETQVGHSISEAIRERDITTRFGQVEAEIVAYFDPRDNEIVINDSLQNAPSAVLAAHIAHEGTHVQWDAANSIDQEYHAFRAQAEVWNELKGDETDDQCDSVSEMIALGREEAMTIIRDLYPDLPMHA